jgi:hypothetical protein
MHNLRSNAAHQSIRTPQALKLEDAAVPGISIQAMRGNTNRFELPRDDIEFDIRWNYRINRDATMHVLARQVDDVCFHAARRNRLENEEDAVDRRVGRRHWYH